jgi:hypothetical protein
MHSSTIRVQNAFGYFTTVAFVLALLVAVSTVLYPPSPSASLRVNHVKVARGRPQYYATKQQEYAIIDFDLDAELASLWNWNTKLVFLWVAVGYDAAGAKGGKWVRGFYHPLAVLGWQEGTWEIGERGTDWRDRGNRLITNL